jgi:hypothetical protein
MRGTHDNRLTMREAQNRAWVGPLPNFGAMPPRAVDSTTDVWAPALVSERHPSGLAPAPPMKERLEPVRQRLEWETRDSMNFRYAAVIQDMGAKQVTAVMLRDHPTNGANAMNPTVSRDDKRSYREEEPLYPDGRTAIERPPLPPRSVFQNPWYQGMDMEGGDVAREMFAGVKEDNRWRDENIAVRVAGRTWDHQWVPKVSLEQIAAVEKLRAERDDYRVNYFTTEGSS